MPPPFHLLYLPFSYLSTGQGRVVGRIGVEEKEKKRKYTPNLDFPGGSDGKASVYNAGDPGLIPGLGRSLGEGNGNPLESYCLENPMDRGAWSATVHGVVKSWTRLSDFTFTFNLDNDPIESIFEKISLVEIQRVREKNQNSCLEESFPGISSTLLTPSPGYPSVLDINPQSNILHPFFSPSIKVRVPFSGSTEGSQSHLLTGKHGHVGRKRIFNTYHVLLL